MFNALIFLVFLCREQPPSGGCVLKLVIIQSLNKPQYAAAFGRLCVETDKLSFYKKQPIQQPPSGGCVLKHCPATNSEVEYEQPPSGGCVLKQHNDEHLMHYKNAAAFGRLCVETNSNNLDFSGAPAAAFGRLCVETPQFS